MKKIVILVLWIVSVSGISLSHAELWNKIVASYNQEVITLWDVERQYTVHQISSETAQVGDQTVFKVSSEKLKDFIKDYLVELIILDEAKGFQVDELTDTQKKEALSRFKNKFMRPRDYDRFLINDQWTESELLVTLSRSLIVESFVKQKILSAYIYIPEDEVRQARLQNPKLSLDDARVLVRRSKLKENLRDWIEALKRKNRVQMVLE